LREPRGSRPYRPRRGGRPGRPSRFQGRGEREARDLKPRPLGDRCNPLCPFFRCGKNALRIKTENYRGRPLRVAWCDWIGDKCIGTKCKYASCAKNALLPDGRCAFAIRRQKVRDFEEELEDLERESRKFGFEDYF